MCVRAHACVCVCVLQGERGRETECLNELEREDYSRNDVHISLYYGGESALHMDQMRGSCPGDILKVFPPKRTKVTLQRDGISGIRRADEEHSKWPAEEKRGTHGVGTAAAAALKG